MKKLTKKRIKETTKLLVSQIEKANSLERIKTLHKRAIIINYFQCKKLHPEFDLNNFKPMPITAILKKMPWYKDQEDYRRDLIMGHRDFFCPIGKDCLDMRDSFILKIKNKNIIFSTKGINIALEKNPGYINLIVS